MESAVFFVMKCSLYLEETKKTCMKIVVFVMFFVLL